MSYAQNKCKKTVLNNNANGRAVRYGGTCNNNNSLIM